MKHIALLLLLTAACGTERTIEVAPTPGGTPPAPADPAAPADPNAPADPSAPGPVTFDQKLPLLNTYCLPCHATAPYLKSETAFNQSQSRQRTQSKNMPPPASIQAKNLSEADRAKIVAP